MIAAAYYNEIDPYAAQWIRNLIRAGHIAPGIVDERSIEDVHPYDLIEFTQCHFFAGVGVWSLALRLAGWSDTREIWTASCPCQPFSTAGKGEGFADERHLWPALFHLVEFHRPSSVFGEQVASKDASTWIDLVHDDMEAVDYAFGAVPFPSASVGAPHLRDRLYWMAYANSNGQRVGRGRGLHRAGEARPFSQLGGEPGSLGHTGSKGLGKRQCDAGIPGRSIIAASGEAAFGTGFYVGGLADTRDGAVQRGEPRSVVRGLSACAEENAAVRPGPTNGFWSDADWLGCRDEKFRPVEPGTFPLADGATSRVGRLRAYGNAINARQAQIFIEIAIECMP